MEQDPGLSFYGCLSFILYLENSKRECQRLQAEVENVEPFEIDGLTIDFDGKPTLTDGKVKVIWSEWEKKAMQNCVICRAGPQEMAKRHGNFTPNTNHYAFGLACLHLRINAFLWICKGFLYKDIRSWSKGPNQSHLIKRRKKELQKRFMDELNLPVYFSSESIIIY